MARRKRRRRRRRPPTRRRAPRPPARRRSRRRGGGRNPNIHTAKGKAQVAGAGALYGYLRNQTEGPREFMDKLVVDKIGPLATHGALLHFVARHTSGKWSSWADAMSTACLGAAGINLGATNFNVEEAAALEGAGDSALEGAAYYEDTE